MARAALIVLDSVGLGAAEDAARYGDEGADTLGHVAAACAAGAADRAGLRAGPLAIPNLAMLGLGEAYRAAHGAPLPGVPDVAEPRGRFGYAVERSAGKDTPSGHWELAGVPVPWAPGTFPRTVPAFPPKLVAELCRRAGLPGILGDRHASGIAIIDELGAEHIETGRPICYTSADSVFQIAAHEEAFGLERLYAVCEIARELVDPLHIGRVIARPFVGAPGAGFRRTPRRRDYARPPPAPTLLDRAGAAGREVVSVGKIGDIFAHRGTGREVKTADNAAAFAAVVEALGTLADGGLVVANLVDFDTEFGHRRDVAGYAGALEAFDRALPALWPAMAAGDLVVVAADHGCDPTFRGTDHTREAVPVLAFGPRIAAGPIGRRDSFADVGASLARHLGLPAGEAGTPW